MISLNNVKRFCKEYWKIENYDLAMADKSQVWHCHHRHEIDWVLPKEELISIGRYYDVHYSELIFLTPKEHRSLHHKGKNVSEETRFKQSSTIKSKGGYSGEKNPNYGKFKYNISYEDLYDLYVVQGLSQNQIAKMYGCNHCTIWLKLKKYNIIKNA